MLPSLAILHKFNGPEFFDDLQIPEIGVRSVSLAGESIALEMPAPTIANGTMLNATEPTGPTAASTSEPSTTLTTAPVTWTTESPTALASTATPAPTSDANVTLTTTDMPDALPTLPVERRLNDVDGRIDDSVLV